MVGLLVRPQLVLLSCPVVLTSTAGSRPRVRIFLDIKALPANYGQFVDTKAHHSCSCWAQLTLSKYTQDDDTSWVLYRQIS